MRSRCAGTEMLEAMSEGRRRRRGRARGGNTSKGGIRTGSRVGSLPDVLPDDGRFPKPTVIEWLCLVVGVVLVLRYAWVLDDAYIYFRYVDNLLFLKRGLVFNAGEYVEGFSSPLWVLLLTVLRLTGANYWVLVRLVGVAAFVVFWGLLVVVNRRLSPPRAAVLNFPLCYLALNYGVLCYFTSGTEAPLVQLAAVVYALFVLRPGSRALQALLAFTPLVRHELAVPFVICLGWSWIRMRKAPLRMLLLSLLVCGAWEAFRIYYYADLFPNTFYLKNETDVLQGLRYVHDTCAPYGAYYVVVFFLLLATFCVSPRTVRQRVDSSSERNNADGGAALQMRERIVMLTLAAPVALYVIKIGGDARHFRYLDFPFCLGVCVCAGIVEHGLARLVPRPARIRTAVLAVAVTLAAGLRYPRQLSAHPIPGEVESQFVDRIADAACHRYPDRHYPRFILASLGSGEKIELRNEYAEYRAQHPACEHADVQPASRCARQYEEFAARIVHQYGLTDPILARTRMESDRPAHKFGLRPLAGDLVEIIRATGDAPGRGMYRAAVEERRAPEWITQNLDSIEVIERKEFNKHHLLENLRLAFTFPKEIDPAARTAAAPTQ